MNDRDYDHLIELLIAGELSSDQHQQLRELVVHELAAGDLADDNEMIDQMCLEPLLRDSFCTDPDAFVLRVAAALDSDRTSESQFTDQVLRAWDNRSRQSASRRSRGRWIGAGVLGVIVAAAVCIALTYPSWFGGVTQSSTEVRLRHTQGEVKIVDSNGQSRKAAAGMLIEPGDTILTSGESSATVAWGDGSHITLTRDASLQWPTSETEEVCLKEGLAVVVLSFPVVFATNHATIEAPAAECVLATSERQTDVSVTRGRARLIASNGKALNVSPGESVVAKATTVEFRKGSATPDEWSEDFDAGLPSGWKQGKLVTASLPNASRGAVGTSLNKGDPCRQIWTYTDWQHGLAVVHKDTCLNLVYRFQTSDRVQVLTLLRSPIPDSPAYDVQVLDPTDLPKNERWWRIPANRWYTVSIPLSRLSNPVKRTRPTESFIATAFNFRPQNHACGLVIDRMWLARGTSQNIEFRPLETKTCKVN